MQGKLGRARSREGKESPNCKKPRNTGYIFKIKSYGKDILPHKSPFNDKYQTQSAKVLKLQWKWINQDNLENSHTGLGVIGIILI